MVSSNYNGLPKLFYADLYIQIKYMSYNLNQGVPLKTNDGTALEEVSDFKYFEHGWLALRKTSRYVKGPPGEHAAN